MIKVSIIVPVYNEEKRINRCIDSLLAQDYDNIEIIVVNDGSTDNTINVLKQYDDKITVISKKNGGQGSARNLGIKTSNGNYLMFVDGDDYISKTMVRKLVNVVEEEKADIAVCDLYKVLNNENVYFKNFVDLCNDNVKNFMMSHSGPVGRLYKKELFIENKLSFKENCIYEDLGVIPLLGLYADKVVYLPCPLYYYVIRSGSSMVQLKYSKKMEDIFVIMEYLKKEFRKRVGNQYDDVLEYLYIEHLLYSAVLRFAKFKRKDMIDQCVFGVENNFPNFRYNVYMKKKSIKFKIVCFLAYHRLYWLLFKLSRMR